MEEKRKTSLSLDLTRCSISDHGGDQQSQCLLEKDCFLNKVDQLHDEGHPYLDINNPLLSKMPKHPFEHDAIDNKIVPKKQRKWQTNAEENIEDSSGLKDNMGMLGQDDSSAIYHKTQETIHSNSGSSSEQSSQINNNSSAKGEMYYLQGEDSVDPVWLNYDTELKPISHLLLSPRNSNGSICSNRSSNADSAVELLTPDEEPQTDYQQLHNIDWYRDHYRKTHQQLSTESGIDLQTLCKTVPSVVVSDHSGPNVDDTGKTESVQQDTSSKSACLSVDRQLILDRQQSLDRQISVDSDDSPYSSTSMSCRSNSSNSLTDLTDFDEPLDEVQELKQVKRVR